jgi:crotonobetainyl-CoA:carnitine CoA-transferase CaiB-like acyl-CoA transferase
VILTVGEVLEHPHTAARGLLRPGDHQLVANPLRWHDLDERPGDDSARPPELGEHTDEVLEQWLGA